MTLRNRPPHILLVEDDRDDEELARIALSRAGLPHTLTVVRDGEEALAWLRDQFAAGDAQHPRLVLLDLKLPKLDGHQVLRRLRADERMRALPVVVFSTSAEPRDCIESYRRGANAYVRKPVNFAEYKRVIADLGRFWVGHNVAPAASPTRPI